MFGGGPNIGRGIKSEHERRTNAGKEHGVHGHSWTSPWTGSKASPKIKSNTGSNTTLGPAQDQHLDRLEFATDPTEYNPRRTKSKTTVQQQASATPGVVMFKN